LGLEEGKQVVFLVRDVKGDLNAVEAAARRLEGEKVDLIWALATSTSLAVKRATKTLPTSCLATALVSVEKRSHLDLRPVGDLFQNRPLCLLALCHNSRAQLLQLGGVFEPFAHQAPHLFNRLCVYGLS
jgi:ABC transporter substrate binding protein